MKKLNTLIILSPILFASACGEDSSEAKDSELVQKQQAHYQNVQPVPWFEYSQERDAQSQIYQARNKNVRTWTVWRSDTGVVEGWCPSIGYPLPYDTSFTNPQAPARFCNNGGCWWDVVGQAEPNGLFASQNSIATWVRCLYDGKVTPVYVESKVTAYAWPIVVEGNAVKRIETEPPSVVLEMKQNVSPPPIEPK